MAAADDRTQAAAEPATASPQALAALRRAVEQFNGGLFWECHETLEVVWIEEHGPLREFYHGVIQAAAGFVHVQRGNWYGAVRLLAGAYEKLVDFTPACLGLDVRRLVDDLAVWRRRLATGGPDGMPLREELPFPMLRFDDEPATLHTTADREE